MGNCLKQYCILFPGLILSLSWTACDLNRTDTAKGAIILGDPATIVTETDAQYLEDAVTDLNDSIMEDEAVLLEEKDTFNNVAEAQRLAQQQVRDSIAEAKAALAKEQQETKAKESAQQKAADKKKTASKKRTTQKEKDKKKKR